jgi:hypothetical protein
MMLDISKAIQYGFQIILRFWRQWVIRYFGTFHSNRYCSTTKIMYRKVLLFTKQAQRNIEVP